MAAGSRWSRPWRTTTRPFNGAATRWPRDLRVDSNPRFCCRPSMGPRPDGRGIGVELVTAGSTFDLQWGRDQMAAGSSLNRTRHVPFEDLQWGRDQMAAGSRHGVHPHSRLSRPSMGPRPDGRGIWAGTEHGGTAGRPSMGPRPDGRGIVGHEKIPVEESYPSMGPRPDGRGIPRLSAWS